MGISGFFDFENLNYLIKTQMPIKITVNAIGLQFKRVNKG